MKIKGIKIEREARDYAIWGAVAAAVNIGIFQLLLLWGIDYRVSNIIALVFSRFFCYFTNKLFVFRTKSGNSIALLREMATFFLGRMVSLFMDYFGVILLVEGFKMGEFVGKLAVAVLVVLANYSFSKSVVFRKKDREEGKP